MKPSSVLIPVFAFVITCISCETTIIEAPVKSPAFPVIPGNDTNPNTSLYQELLDEYDSLGLPGISIAIETPEYGWWIGCAGMARIEDKTMMNPSHTFNIESMSKVYIATLIMRLYEDQQLQLDDPARNYLPGEMVNNIANADVATIRQLLNHTSGILDLDFTGQYVDIFNDPLYPETIEDQFEIYLYGKRAYADAGEEYHYSNTGYALLGMIIEEVTGSLGDYFEQEIIEPLGLTNTYFKSSEKYPDIDNLANGYAEPFSGQLINATDIEKNDMILCMGQGGVITNPYENALFLKALMQGNILDPPTLQQMIADEIDYDENFSQGLGLKHGHGD